jgi:hypothetical protein
LTRKKKQIKLKKKYTKKHIKRFFLFRYLFYIEQYPFALPNKLKKTNYILKLRVKTNNIFVTLNCFSKDVKRTLKTWSCGLQQLNSSKRKLKFVLNIILVNVLKELKLFKNYIFCLKAPRFLYKFIFKIFKKMNVSPLLILFDSIKIFNGCRVKKIRRKKFKRFRALK